MTLICLIIYNQGANIWNRCYHSSRYPVTTFECLDNILEPPTSGSDFNANPNANSTQLSLENGVEHTLHNDSPPRRPPPKPQNIQLPSRTEMSMSRNASYGEGIVIDINHTPRRPPTPTTYSIPSIFNKSAGTSCGMNKSVEVQEEVFGMITLKENDVCYTSGTIEWVGRKRNFPLNSGFKVIKDANMLNESNIKKMRKYDKDRTYTLKTDDKQTDCECADVMPTVCAIINHLDALHEAVDIVDIRLNNLESTVNSSRK